MARHLIIDTDTASDDAVALVMALRYPGVQVEAITTVAGNVPVEQATQNALYTLELCGGRTPVYQGASRPLLRPLFTAQFVHGQDGMGDIGLPVRGRTPASGDGVAALIEAIRRFAGQVTLVTLGPLTNVALALRQEPSIVEQVERCVVMGGVGRGLGNITPVAEYNIWVDPEAARIVFEAGLRLTMVGIDVSHGAAVFTPDEAAQLRAAGGPLAEFCVDIQACLQRFTVGKLRLAGFDLPDPVTMAVALDPGVVTQQKRLHVAVETGSELCRGQTVVDHLGVTGNAPNVDVVLEASRERFLRILYDAVRETLPKGAHPES